MTTGKINITMGIIFPIIVIAIYTKQVVIDNLPQANTVAFGIACVAVLLSIAILFMVVKNFKIWWHWND